MKFPTHLKQLNRKDTIESLSGLYLFDSVVLGELEISFDLYFLIYFLVASIFIPSTMLFVAVT